MHRLNRTEYSNTVRDLLGEPLALGATQPEDQINQLGFDNDGTSLLTSSLLVERWSDLAEELVANAFARMNPVAQNFDNIVAAPCKTLQAGIDVCGTVNGGYYMSSAATGYWGMISAVTGLTVDQMTLPADGVYTISLSAFATPVVAKSGAGKTPAGQPYPVTLAVSIDGNPTNFDITQATFAAPKTVTVTGSFTKGTHALAITSVRDAIDPDNQDGNWYTQTAWVGKMSLTGPTSVVPTPNLLDCTGAVDADGGPADPTSDACVQTVLQNFTSRAWRRPPTDDEIAQLMALVAGIQNSADEPGDALAKTTQGIKIALQAALLSPHFVYRPELDPDPNAGTPRLLNGYELASRLSYFLWSSMPDDELFGHAADATLTNKDELERQVDRMLTDPKASAFVESFAGQWLQLRQVPGVSPDTTLFPKFNNDVRDGMLAETQAFFTAFLQPGHSFPNMLDANFTFVNPTLAAYYGLKPGAGAGTTQVSLAGSQRVGLLSQGSFLTLTSHANRTSPVLRGKFVLKQLLCSAPPPPPANVPPFNEDVTAGSVRKRLEAHVSVPACSACHNLMDPIGFSLENFDAVGQHRTDDNGAAIDTSGLALSDTPISDVTTLAAAVKSSPLFVPCVVQNFLSYGLGHQVDNTDDSGIPALAAASAATGYELSSLIHIIVKSDAFLNHQGGSQ